MGGFHLLFSAGLPLGAKTPGLDVPSTFKQLDVGKIFKRTPLPAGALCTNGVRAVPLTPSQPPTSTSSPSLSLPYVHSVISTIFSASDPDFRPTESASGTSFRLAAEQGAALLTKHSTYREDLQRAGTFEKYAKEHYDSWVTFAKETGHGDVNPILVTGVDRTRDFAMLCYSNDDDNDPSCEFTTSVPGATGWGSWNKTGMIYTNHGPQPSSPQGVHVAPSGDGNAGTVLDEYNQCIFIRYYTVRKRPWITGIVKAAAGWHDLRGGRCDRDVSSLEARYDSDQDSESESESDIVSSLFDGDDDGCSVTSTETESDITVHNTTAVRYFFAPSAHPRPF